MCVCVCVCACVCAYVCMYVYDICVCACIRTVCVYVFMCLWVVFIDWCGSGVCDAFHNVSLHSSQSYGRDPRKCLRLTQPAVNGVCVGVKRGECFGLLGING